MTRKSRSRLARDQQGLPNKRRISRVVQDHSRSMQYVLTNDMLINQLQREGPRVARSFDRLAKNSLVEGSKLFSLSQGMLFRHLPRVNDNGFKATSARLLSNAANSYVAAVEVARHGFPRQYGSLARMVVETLATVLALGTKSDALENFHAGKLASTKCVTWAKQTLPVVPPLWGMLSNEFVHIGKGHSDLDMPKLYTAEDQALGFVCQSMLIMAWLLYVVTELVYADEQASLQFWAKSGEGWTFNPSAESIKWMDEHLQ